MPSLPAAATPPCQPPPGRPRRPPPPTRADLRERTRPSAPGEPPAAPPPAPTRPLSRRKEKHAAGDYVEGHSRQIGPVTTAGRTPPSQSSACGSPAPETGPPP